MECRMGLGNSDILYNETFLPYDQRCRDPEIPQPITLPLQILSGHWRLRSFLHRINVEPDSWCSCRQDSETFEYFLFHCPSFEIHRIPFKNQCIRSLGIWPPSLQSIGSELKTIKAMSSFIFKTKRLNFDNPV